MRRLHHLFAVAALLAVGRPALTADRPNLVEVPRKTVLVELFTSQG